MGTLKDLVDLVTQLDASIQDRKTREMILPVKELALDVQKSQFELEKRHKEEIDKLKATHHNEVTILRQKISRSQENQNQLDQCPFCKQFAGNLESRQPHPVFETYVHIHDYKCGHCGKQYQKESQT